MPEPPQPEPFADTSALLQQAERGDQRALHSLLLTHLGWLRALVHRRTGPWLPPCESPCFASHVVR